MNNIETGWYLHIKTGNRYDVKGTVINATNVNDGEIMVLYKRADKSFVREISEFKNKFQKIHLIKRRYYG